MNLREKLIEDAKTFAHDQGISEERLGVIVANNGKFIKRLVNGGDCTLESFEKFEAVFKSKKAWAAAKSAAKKFERKRRKSLQCKRLKESMCGSLCPQCKGH